MHQLFTNKIRNAIVAISAIGLLWYCFSNYSWDIPHADFRPFKKGADVATQYDAELNAMANVRIVAWKLKNRESGKVVELSNEVYMKEFKNYPKEEWEIIDQVQTEPEVAKTKISDFEIETTDGDIGTDDFLRGEGYRIMIVSHKVKGEGQKKTRTVIDTVYQMDTILLEDGSAEVVQSIKETINREEEYVDYTWNEGWKSDYTDIVKPFVMAASQSGIETGVVAGGASTEMLNDLEGEIGLGASYYLADDILLKTIVRSNPGIVLWKDGTIIDKWHKRKLPEWSKVANQYKIK